MSRFAWPSKYAMRVNSSGKNSSTLAYFTIIDTEIGIEFRDVQLKQRKDGGNFVSSPFRSYDQDGETKYVNFWRAGYDEDEGAYMEAGVAYLDEMTAVALKKYKAMSKEEGGNGGGNGGGGRSGAKSGGAKSGGSKSGAKGGQRSGRGPAVDTEDDDDFGF